MTTFIEHLFIFCSDLQWYILTKSKRLNADGTFKVWPEFLEKLLLADFKGVCLSCAFNLLGGKIGNTNNRMLFELKDSAL